MPKIILASINNAYYQSLADITVTKNKLIYCRRYNYIPYFKNKDWHNHIPDIYQPNTHELGFEKISTILEIMDKYPDSNYIWFTDCDSLITNLTIKIEDVINKYWNNNYLMMASEDGNGLNVGSLVIINSPEAREYCQWIYSQKETYKDKSWNEQQVIIDSQLFGSYQARICLVPQNELNAYDYTLYQPHQFNKPLDKLPSWKSGDLLIHWPGTNLEERLVLANKYLGLTIS
jgi:hypothetical protein